MRYMTIKDHLRPYLIVTRRRTTINHAFASAIAPNDDFADSAVRDAIRHLGQDPDADLICVYCTNLAQTWDHVYGTVRNSAFSGYGHRIGNLLPCCKPCNSAKGNLHWETYLERVSESPQLFAQRQAKIASYLARYLRPEIELPSSADHLALEKIRIRVLELLVEADVLADRIRRSRA